MKSNTYWMSSLTGSDGVSTYFSYDDMGRLLSAYEDEARTKKIQEYAYHIEGAGVGTSAPNFITTTLA